MDDVRFDALTRAFSQRMDRRSTLRAFLGIGGAAVAATMASGETEAARRGYSGPQWPAEQNETFCSSESDTCDGGATCFGGAGHCIPGYDTPNISYCVISTSLQFGVCGSCHTHDDCYQLTGDPHSPCLIRDERCQDCAGIGGACGVLVP